MSPDRPLTDRNYTAVWLLTGIFALNIVSILLQVFLLNPTAQTNQDSIESAQKNIRTIACANAGVIANVFRGRLTNPTTGKQETTQAWRSRVLAQQYVLEVALSARCQSPSGFIPFSIQVGKALDEIADVLDAIQSKADRGSLPGGVRNPGLMLGPNPIVIVPDQPIVTPPHPHSTSHPASPRPSPNKPKPNEPSRLSQPQNPSTTPTSSPPETPVPVTPSTPAPEKEKPVISAPKQNTVERVLGKPPCIRAGKLLQIACE